MNLVTVSLPNGLPGQAPRQPCRPGCRARCLARWNPAGVDDVAGVGVISYALVTETLTFLFTDIEGSTALLSRLGGEAYAGVLADHCALIRAGLAAHDGHEVNTQGDGLFAVFPFPSGCVAAVIETQRALAAHEWPPGGPVRVRMGVHCGEASVTAAGVVGLEVHRAARIAAVAHGGQVLVSAAAAALVRDWLPAGAWLGDLGLHRLKDLGRPEQIFQLGAEGLAGEFPPLRSLDNPELPNNLPGFLSVFVGREAELAEVRSLVESSRLVTLTGAGGSGKTRLALQVAAELLDGSGEGVFFADLAPVTDAGQVPGAVAAALGLREQAGRPALEVLLEVLRGQSVLIVLDNCEHVVDACAKLADLVERGCPRVHLLVTSREPLGIDGERVYRLRPLSLPPPDAASVGDLTGSDAVELFTERARSHDSGFALEDSTAGLVASICLRLDGIPLALELAAARLSAMSLVHLNERLDQRFRLLTGGSRTAVARQRTLQATVEWSVDLLTEPERAVLRRLSVFAGGFELDAAEAIGATGDVETSGIADVLASLVNKSLVVAEPSAGSLRYRLLETIRQYAADQLVRTGGDAEAARARSAHAGYYLQLAETAAAELTGPRQGRWLKRLDLDWDNLRAALAYLSAEPGRTGDVLRIGVALFRFLTSRGHQDPAAQLRAALDRADPVPPGLRARALYVASYLMIVQALESRRELGTARELAERALEMARDLDDREFVALALGVLCVVAALQDEPGQAAPLGEEALEVARSVGDPRLIGEAVFCLSWVPASADRRRELELEALASFRQAGDTLYIAAQLNNLASLEAADGYVEAARDYYEEAIAAADEIGAVWLLAGAWDSLAIVLLLQGELTEAEALARKSLITARRLGLGRIVAGAIFVLTCCATGAGDYCRAAQLTGAHDVIDAAALDASPDHFWTPLEQRARDDNRARLRQALGEGEFDRAYRAGRTLGLDQAADLALGRARPAR